MSLARNNLDSGLVNIEEFFSIISEDEKADLIDGVIYMASPVSTSHYRLEKFLEVLLDLYLEETGAGEVFGSRVAFVLGESSAPEPDIAFVSSRHSDRIQEGRINGPPDLAVEIVSPESRDRDYLVKKALYERGGVQEYWIIDPAYRRAEFYGLRDGVFVPLPLESNRYFISQVVSGFWIDVEWLFSDERPPKQKCLERILAGLPSP